MIIFFHFIGVIGLFSGGFVFRDLVEEYVVSTFLLSVLLAVLGWLLIIL